ncbi:hypothetical protein EJB05_34845, partial [Eragrostis curvula]
METSKHSMLCLVPLLLLAAGAKVVAHDDLTTFIIHPDGSSSAFFPLVYTGASGNPLAELCGTGSLDGMDVKGKIVLCEYWSGPGGNITRIMKGAVTWNRSMPVVVQRTVKNVGKVPSTYTPKVDMPAGDVTIDVSPSELVFTENGTTKVVQEIKPKSEKPMLVLPSSAFKGLSALEPRCLDKGKTYCIKAEQQSIRTIYVNQ